MTTAVLGLPVCENGSTRALCILSTLVAACRSRAKPNYLEEPTEQTR